MNKRKLLLSLIVLMLIGCQSNNKDERYNNMSPTDIYYDGVKNVNKKRYTQAISDFEALESRYPFGEYADKSQLGAIYAYYLEEDYAAALPAVERFIRMYPRHPHVDYAHYIKGLIHYSDAKGFFSKYIPSEREDRDTTSARKALTAFSVVVNAYPYSIYTPDSKLRIVYLRNILAESELVAAHFYMQKGAYLAAANRASYVITNFDRSPSMPEALAIMVRAYRALELPQLADDAYRVLALNYPDSLYVQELS